MEQELLHDAKVEFFTEVQKMKDILKDLEKHLENVSQIYQNMESLQAKIEELDQWINLEKNFLDGLLIIQAYHIRLHTLATNEFQELALKFEEKVKKSIARIMKVYTDNVQGMQKDIQWPQINIQSKKPIPFAFFQQLEDEYEAAKVEVLARELISKEDIQELLIRLAKKVSKFNAFVRKFKDEMDSSEECHLTLDIKKEHVFNSREQWTISQHEAWSKHIKSEGG